MASTAADEVYDLPASAVGTLSDEGLLLELHCISFSHYCMRAAWALQIAGLPYKQVNYLPLSHVLGIKRLQAKFKQGPGARTASNPSPFATPVLAVYTRKKEPLCLLSNSALISRYAALRAKALGLPTAHQLYGDSLALNAHSSGSSSGASTVVGGDELYERVSELELRLSGAMGIEVRRVMYYYLLPSPRLGGMLFYRNSGSALQRLCSPLVYLACTLLLPQAMKINAKTVERGKQRLRAEFDFFDQLLAKASLQQQQQEEEELVVVPVEGEADGQGAPDSTAAAALGGSHAASSSSNNNNPGKLPYYLCGAQMTAADVSLASLAGHVVGVSGKEMGLGWSPAVDDMPQDSLKPFMQELRGRPTGRFVLDMWKVHGPFQQSITAADNRNKS